MALLGRWKLTEGTGTSGTDSSGNSRTATLRGTATWANSSRYGGGPALSTPGTDNNVATVEVDATILAVTAISFGGWVRFAATTANYDNIFTKQQNNPGSPFLDDFVLAWSTSNSGWYVDVKATTVVGGAIVLPTPALNTWIHAFVTYNSTAGLRFYLDGVDRGGFAANGAVALTTTTKIIIGAGADQAGDIGANTAQNAVNGLMSDVQLHDVALTASEVRYAMMESDSFRPRPVGRPAPFKPGNAR